MSKSIKYSGSRFSSSSSDDGDYAGDKIFKKVEDLDIDPDETTPQTINAFKKRIKELKEYGEELRLNLEARKRLVKEHKEEIAKFREQIEKLKEELAKEKEQGQLLKNEIKTVREYDTGLSKKIDEFNLLQAEVKQLKDKLKGLKSKQMEERQQANIAKGKKPKPDIAKEFREEGWRGFSDSS